jgi:hypothetical protein
LTLATEDQSIDPGRLGIEEVRNAPLFIQWRQADRRSGQALTIQFDLVGSTHNQRRVDVVLKRRGTQPVEHEPGLSDVTVRTGNSYVPVCDAR